MKHGRADYARIQDPAADLELLAAYARAQKVLAVARSTFEGDNAGTCEIAQGRQLCSAIDHLIQALASTIEPILAYPPRNPIAPDEPVFLLRAQDSLAPHLVREYARVSRQRSPGGVNEWLRYELITDVAKAMEGWQLTHRHKLPDAPTVITRGGAER